MFASQNNFVDDLKRHHDPLFENYWSRKIIVNKFRVSVKKALGTKFKKSQFQLNQLNRFLVKSMVML